MTDKINEIKAVVWDLDGTLWDGVLLEADHVELKPGVREALSGLDRRGILHSVASRSEYEPAMAQLKALGIADYFLYPEIGWGAKSAALARIQKNLNIGMESLLFIDDQAFERDEVKSEHPDIACLDPGDYAEDFARILELPQLQPRFVTEDSRRRRLMYLEDIERAAAEKDFAGPKEEFLAGLKMHLVIARAAERDLQRAEELTVRTHQLNATGRTYSYDELNAFRLSASHELLAAELTDIYGSYGKIGLALLEKARREWWIRLLLVSCRVVARGVGTMLLSHIIQGAKAQGVRLLADFVPTDRNRQMYVSYKFAGFREVGSGPDGLVVMENDFSNVQPFPEFVQVQTDPWKPVAP